MKLSVNSLRVAAALVLASAAYSFVQSGPAAGLATFVVGSVAHECLRQRRRSALCYTWTGVGLGDIFIPTVYADIVANDSPEKTAFAQSGVVVKNPLLQAAAQSGTRKVEVPTWNDLDASQVPNISDATDTLAAPKKVSSASMDALNAYLNQGWGAADLATEMAGATPGNGDPMTRIKNRIESYWAKQFQYRIIAASRGILADNVANDSGDMIYNIAAESTGAQSESTKFSADALIEACFTLGDSFDVLAAFAIHSVPYKRLVKQQLIDFVADASGTLNIPTYLGKRVIVDDGLPVIAGTTSGLKYLTILYGSGAFGYGEGSPVKPEEVDRTAAGGNGGGLETLWSRKTWMIHPLGFDWIDGSRAGESATLAELRLAANWDRAYARKSCRIAYLQTN